MKLTIELQAYLRQYSPDGAETFEYDLPDGSRVWDLVQRLAVPEELASIIIVGGANADYQHPLHEGDHVTLIPPLSGGER
jgi:molybdopterin converting factor small subunit